MYNSLSTQNNNTDIVTITSVLGKPNCKVGTLAGNSEDIFIKLYQANHDGFLSGKSCPYLGITVEADQKKFYLWISSSDRNFPLCNHDTLTFNFARESLTMIFRKTGHMYAKERRNILVLNKYQFKYLTDNYVQSAELFNNKTKEKEIINSLINMLPNTMVKTRDAVY